MSLTTEKIRSVARDVLAKGEAKLLLGWQKGSFWWQSPPAFVSAVDEADRLVWDPFCVNNLSKYLLEELQQVDKIALFVKGCDALAINRLLQDSRISREQVLLLGVPCRGMVDPDKLDAMGLKLKEGELEWQEDGLLVKTAEGEKKVDPRELLYDKCLTCRYPNPVVYDQLLDEEVTPYQGEDRFAPLKQLEKLSADERYAYWNKQFDRCIQCFACRNICPACNCRECVFDIAEPRWLGKADVVSEKAFYHLIRAFHVAGRCLDCGECERVCPMDIPLSQLNRRMIQDVNKLFGEYEAGVDPEAAVPLITYREDEIAAFGES